MISMHEYMLTEGVWSFIKNSIANLFGKRMPVKVKAPDLTPEEKIERHEAIQRRLTPKPKTTKKLGFEEVT